MGYVIAGILVVLIVGGFIMFMVTNASKRSNVSDAGDPGSEGSPAMFASDPGSPAGDTREHAGEQNESGETVANQDADRHGGTGEAAGGYASTGPVGGEADDENVARPVVGGEAEGERRVD
jgi:hypothetical protein